jgi:hypothetical protein
VSVKAFNDYSYPVLVFLEATSYAEMTNRLCLFLAKAGFVQDLEAAAVAALAYSCIYH